MASSAYLDSYCSYKAGTEKLISWLVDAGKRCNADMSSLDEPAGKSNTASHDKYLVPLVRITAIAKSIASTASPKITLPASLITITKAVLALRKKCSLLFSKLAKSDARIAASNKSHRHFETVLEEVLTLLSPSPAPDDVEDLVAEPTRADMSNMFAALNVEEPSADTASSAPKTKTKKGSGLSTVKYEIEPEFFDDIVPILAFFDDIRAIRQYIEQVWTGYRQGHQCSMSASVTTDTAMLVIKQMCEDVTERLPDVISYKHMCFKLYDYLANQSDGVNNDAWAELTCAPTAVNLEDFCRVLHPKRLPIYKPGHFGHYDAQRDRSKLSAMWRQTEDMIVLFEALPEFAKLARYNIEVPGEDLLTKALRNMINTCSLEGLPIYGIFATQIFLDIHHVLRQDVSRPLSNLQNSSQRIVHIFDEWFKFSSDQQAFDLWPEIKHKLFRHVQTTAREWGVNDYMGRVKTERLPGAENFPKRPFHLLSNHPTLCGLIEFQLNMLVQHAGESLCNAWGSLYSAHLYNACEQSAGLQQDWDDIDYILKVHGALRIFVGAAPTTAEDYLKRFVLQLGGSATNFARNRRPGGRQIVAESKKGPRGLKTTTPVRDIWSEYYVHGNQLPVLNTANILAMVSVAAKAERASPPSIDMNSFTAELQAQKSFSTLQLLTAVREGVAGEELGLLFDYIGLHMRSYKMLRGLREHLHAELVKYFGGGYLDNESQLPYVIGYVFEVVVGSKAAANKMVLGQGAAGSAILHKASEYLADWLAEEKNRAAGVIEAKSYCYANSQSQSAGTS